MKLKEKAKILKHKTSAVYLAMKCRETPVCAKIMAGLTVAYALSPIDLIPDFIPVLGYLDDIIILPLMIAASIKLIPKEVMEKCEAEAETMWQNGKPKKWYFALPIIIIWCAVIALIVWKIIEAFTA